MHIQNCMQVMKENTNDERSLFPRFFWGRTRLAKTLADFRGRNLVIQVCKNYLFTFKY